MKIILLSCLAQIFYVATAQIIEIPFKTEIAYTYLSTNILGDRKFFPIEKEEIYFNESQLLSRVIKGHYKRIVGNNDVLLDIRLNKRYEINHASKIISELSQEENASVDYLDSDTLGRGQILGYDCQVISFWRVIKDDLNYKTDSVHCTYYLSNTIRLLSPTRFAALQGNRNSKILDGNLPGLPLKIIIKYNNGDRLVLEATKIQIGQIEFPELYKYKVISK